MKLGALILSTGELRGTKVQEVSLRDCKIGSNPVGVGSVATGVALGSSGNYCVEMQLPSVCSYTIPQGNDKIVQVGESWVVPFSFDVDVMVRCSCSDYRFRFYPYNKEVGADCGEPFPPYESMGRGKSANPRKSPGLCKHLFSLLDWLRQSKVIVGDGHAVP